MVLIYSTNSFAQLGGLLKDLKTLSDTIKQQQPPNNTTNNNSPSSEITNPTRERSSPSNPTSAPSSSFNNNALILNYCNKINSSPVVIKLVEDMKKNHDAGGAFEFRRFFTSSTLDIKNWVSTQLNTKFNLSAGTGYPNQDRRISIIAETINKCVSSDKEKPAAFFAAGWGTKDLNKSFSVESPLDRFQSIDLNKDLNLYLLTFMFDGSDELIQNLKPSPLARLDAELLERTQNNQIKNAQAAEKKKQDDRDAAADKKVNELLAAAEKYLNTPDGKLVWSYQHFQIIQLCYDLRKDFAVKYIAPSDYSDYRNKIKSIENKLKSSLTQKNTDALYARAEERNRNYQIFYPTLEDKTNGIDLFKLITEKSKGNSWIEAKNNCDSVTGAFREISDNILGSQPMKKSF